MTDIDNKFDKVLSIVVEELGKVAQLSATNHDLFRMSEKFKSNVVFAKVSSTQGTLTSQSPWSSFLEYGNPYEGAAITPKNKKVLHFFVDGQEVFTKKSTAHGPLPFMHNAGEEAAKQAESIVAQALRVVYNK